MFAALMPPSASTQAVVTDRIFFALLALSVAIILLVLALVIVFAIRYRRGSKAKRGAFPPLLGRHFEIGWTAATLFIFLSLFWWVGAAQLSALIAPKAALEIHVVAKQWMWKTQHASGAREINELHVPLGVPVRLVMTSEDVIHSFFVPAFRMKKDVVPGRYTETWFTATELGAFHLFCAEYCGTDHARMQGRVVVMRPDDYASWLTAQPQGDDIAHQGAALFVSRGCSGCHAPASRVHAPNLKGVYGRRLQLADGRSVVADEAYIRDSMLQPKRDVAAGYEPIMPSFAEILPDSEIQALTAYIRSLSADAAADPDRPDEKGLAPGSPDERSPAMSPGGVSDRSGTGGTR